MRVPFSTLFLVLVNAALLAALGGKWLSLETGQLKQAEWLPPPAVSPALPPSLPASGPAPVLLHMAMLDRPLFAPDRRPPLLPDQAPPLPPPDPLADVILSGLLTGDQWAGATLFQAGKTRRLAMGQSLGDWTLTAIDQRNATFSRGEETRVLVLTRQKTPVAVAPKSSAANGGPMPLPSAGDVEDENRARMIRLQQLLKQQNR